ncbi:hypothetical protein L211DRAFT_775314 [Terfezia boudieri ATCC MYA-4762]|uniref:Arrestin C-terminal-like domain-containing protein n=1 Tax=Terfezia boudieri ATCC MYA-4762 TaxID=1051890 RepID=A0A3N4M432_9PEZI|nr:hypothetical protein L211DRAFT_775314 [Terfezia boudieri ATCC MYA-4762]
MTLERARAGPIGGGISGIPSHAESLLQASPIGRPRSRSTNSILSSTEKPLASTSGGAVSMTIVLQEPVLFLRGNESSDYTERSSTMLRGKLLVKINKATKVKGITLAFRGRSRTEWPEGIPPRKSEFFEEKEIMTHIWPFFNSAFPTAELGSCADHVRLANIDHNSSIGSAIESFARSASPIGRPSRLSNPNADKRLSLSSVQSRSFSRSDSCRETVVQKGHRVFQPGEYTYNFELPLESCLPETMEVELGSVKYELEATLERAGAFRPKLTGKREVILIRCPSESSLEGTEPIAISRTWEDQLHYDIVISGKSFPLNSTIPIAFKLTPLAKVRCHRIKVYITENIEYSCRNKKMHRIDSTRKILLFDKRADGTTTSAFAGSTSTIISGGGMTSGIQPTAPNTFNDNILGDLTGELNVGPTEMEFNVQLPGCNVKEKERIHFDTTCKDIQVHHWIKIVMRLSKADANDPSKRRHFEISIDSPFHVLSCRATGANTALPAYSDNCSTIPRTNNISGSCNCPPLGRRGTPNKDGPTTTICAINPPSDSGVDLPAAIRPLHLLRIPSLGPPPFDPNLPPPPSLITPPPNYESVVGNNATGALADYFSRLAAGEDTDDDVAGEGQGGGRRRGLTIPLTPGGRVNRSMDETRTWEPIMR